ncbi:MAG: OmpA family protein [Phaeodactylibacter sp.]|uniref:OmpA family protein n=1 Tax=Phaeodactylibacter sp. TaxID=1940289 RepID=UPI0032EF58BE
MTFPIKLLVATVVWLLFYLVTFRSCQQELCMACAPPPVSPTDTIEAEKALPLYFKWSDPEAYVGKGIEAWVQQELQRGDTAQVLQITGLYFEGEDVPLGAENMGLARASEVARLFDGKLSPDELQLRARQVEPPEGATRVVFEGALLEWVDPEVSNSVDRLADRVSIRFPPGSAAREYAPEVDAYLVQLAGQLKSTGGRVKLTGHTDNSGLPAQNQKLGLARAESVRKILVANGVPAAQILIASRGSDLPVAANDTEEGRHQNRRVEIQFVPSAEPQQKD